MDGALVFTLGTQDSASWNPGTAIGANPLVTYSYGAKKVIVELVCAKSGPGDFEALGENPENTFKFRLTNKCACWDGCSSE